MTWNMSFEVKDGKVDAETLKVAGAPPEGPVSMYGYQAEQGRSLTLNMGGVTVSGYMPMPAPAAAPKAVVLDPAQFARDAYRAYGEATGGKNFRGEPMPAWEDLGDTIRGAWVAATTAVTDRVSG